MQLIHSGFGCFCWALPVFCWFCVCLLSDETQIWLGDLRVVVCGCCLCFVVVPLFVDYCSYTAAVLCTFLAFTIFTSVRTEPQATSAAPEKKKGCLLLQPYLVPNNGNRSGFTITFCQCSGCGFMPKYHRRRSPKISSCSYAASGREKGSGDETAQPCSRRRR